MPRSAQQERAIQSIIRSILHPDQRTHLVLEAVAGAGKTFTLLEIVREVQEVRPDARILLLAFNVEIGPTPVSRGVGASAMARQLRERLAGNTAEVYTLHAFGMQLLEGPDGSLPRIDPDKGYRVWRELVGLTPSVRDWAAIRASVDRLRQDGEDAVGEPPADAPLATTMVHRVLTAMNADQTCIDTEDQMAARRSADRRAFHTSPCSGGAAWPSHTPGRLVRARRPILDLVLVDESQGRKPVHDANGSRGPT